MTRSATQIKIRSCHPEDHGQVVEMFKTGMLYYAEDEIKGLYAEYVERCIKDDLASIHRTYIESDGHFWIAIIEEDDNEIIVGMVGLEGKPNQEGELRRMSIKSEYRRFGVGRVLVKHLEDWAKGNGMKQVWLSTFAAMKQACKFYEGIGYSYWKTEGYSRHPSFGVVYYEKELIE